MFGKSRKQRELEAELLAENPELSTRRAGGNFNRNLKTVGKNILLSYGTSIPIALGSAAALKIAMGKDKAKNDTPTYKKLVESVGDDFGGNHFSAHYNPDNNKVYVGRGGQDNSKILAHEIGHREIQNGLGLGTSLQKIRVNPYYGVGSELLAGANAVHAGSKLAKDKILGRKSSLFDRYRGAGGYLLTSLPTLHSEANASLKGYKIYKDAGGQDTSGYKKKMAGAYSTYLVATLAKMAGGWILSKMTKEIGINKYKGMSEVERVAYITKLLKNQPEYKGFSTKDLAKVAYNRMSELNKELGIK